MGYFIVMNKRYLLARMDQILISYSRRQVKKIFTGSMVQDNL